MGPAAASGRARGPDGRDGPHVFVEDLAVPVLSEVDRHHLERVLRLRSGDLLTVSDGCWRWAPCRFGPELELVGEVDEVERPAPEVAIGFVIQKGERPEWTVQKLTELGVDRILLLRSERSVVRWQGERAGAQIERLRRVAREAAMQCRRCSLPVLEGVLDLAAVTARWPAAARTERGGPPPSLAHPVLLVGPEGGWSPAEREQLGAEVGLGAQQLRAETAALAAAALLAALRDGTLGEARPI